MLNNRQGNNSRRRGRNNNNSQRPQGSGQSRNGETGNRIDNRARGNAPQLLEKYKTLARDAQTQGDRVLTEYYHQFADHYFRVVAETRTRFEESRRPRDDWDGNESDEVQNDSRSGYDDGLDEEGTDRGYDEGNRNTQAPAQQRARGYNEDRAESRDRYERGAQSTPANQQAERDTDRGAPSAEGRNWEARVERAPRSETRPRDANPPHGPRFTRGAQASEAATDRPLTLDQAVLPPAIATTTSAEAENAIPAPKKRGRPRKLAVDVDAG